MLLEEWNWDEAKEVWLEEGVEAGLKMAEAKYQPVIEETRAVIEEKDRENRAIKREIEEKDRENEWLRWKLQEAGIDPQQGHASFE
jgi:predicted RNase H-like nuclease (RuvC/YqgF family)